MSADAFAPLQELISGQYVLERELGRGGMGTVYLARETRLDRLVAVKVLPRELGANPELRERFLREARTAAQLSHPNIVPIFRADEVGGFAFFTMAFIEGESLAERLRARGPLPPIEAVRVLREAAWALAYAHARGVVHRDVKPENIMLERGSNRAVVTDFGIARDQLATSLTLDGWVLGSVHYMSPEQAAGDNLDGRSDLYSLGVVGFQILSGLLPFDGVEAASIMAQQVTRQAPSLASVAGDLPRALASVIDRCLRKAPSDRYPTGEALAEALEGALQSTVSLSSVRGSNEMVATDQARAIWLRAAQLQTEAAKRLQVRYRNAATAAADAPKTPTGGYRLKDVELAAIEAGISQEYITMAMAERSPGDSATAATLSTAQERLLSRMLGTRDRSVSVSRTIRGSPRAVLEAIGRVSTVHPFSLKLRDTVGGHPLDGGILVFDVQMIRSGQVILNETPSLSMFSYRMTQIELDQLNVVLRPLGSPADSCEVTVYGDLRKGLLKNWRMDKWISSLAAMGGGASGTALGVAALSLGPFAVLTALAGGAVFGAGSLSWYRWLYTHGLSRSREELDRLLASVEGDLRSVSVFGSRSPQANPHGLPRAMENDAPSTLIV
ncbi:MAG: serine/threonine protein kinase [Anaerolineae bacterium]|nr:serine/threonine protein kinase [Gemmatimonadaceae bacterium]